MKITIALLLSLVLAFSAAPALAQAGGQSASVVALHVQSHNAKGVTCGDFPPELACSQFTTTWPVGVGADVYLVVSKARADLGISGLSCGIAYDAAPGSGVDVFGTALCGDLDYPNVGPNGEWPASHGGNRIFWVRTTNCQQGTRGADGVHALAYAFYVYAYSPDEFSVIRNENLEFGPGLLVVDCVGPANSAVPYPYYAGTVGFGASGYNPCTEAPPGDLIPPLLAGASGDGGTVTVQVVFSEAVGSGAEVAFNYSVYPAGNPAAPLEVLSAAASGSTVTLTLDGTLASSTQYRVKVTGVEDLAGNVIVAGSAVDFISGVEVVTPLVLSGASGEAGSDQVTVRFSKQVGEGAATPGNYTVYPLLNPSATLGVVSATASADVVTLTLDSPLASSTDYRLLVSNVRDLEGNVIEPGSLTGFRTDYLDSTPPVLLAAGGSAGTKTVTLGFSEAVPGGGSDPANYSVYPSDQPGATIGIALAMPSGTHVALTLYTALAPSTEYTVSVSNVTDASGNAIAPNSTARFVTDEGDVTPPVLLSATGLGGANSLTLTFSEHPEAGATDPASYSVYLTANPAATNAVLSASVFGADVTLALHQFLTPSTSYTVAVSGVADAAGNVIAPNSTVTFVTGNEPDTTPPTLLGASGLAGTHTVVVTFSEVVASGADDPSNYSVALSIDPTHPLALTAAAATAAQVELTLSTGLTWGTSYRVTVSNVADAAGNVILPNSVVSFTTAGTGGQGSQSQSVVALHAQAHNTKGLSCANLSPTLSCDQFTTVWPLRSGADVYMVVALADPILGVSGVSLGVDYGNTPGARTDGVGCDVLGYTSCSDLEYTNGIDVNDVNTEFPAAGGGNRLIWVRTSNCQVEVRGGFGVHAVACAFYVYAYSPDQFRVDMNRNLVTGPEFQIVDCPGPALYDMSWPSHAGILGFGAAGYNPCTGADPVPTVHTTWGRLKNQYR